MQITPLASGSQGNSLLVRARDQHILVDAGLPCEDLEARLAETGTKPAAITAICLTHRHRDHKLGLADFAKRHRTPVYGTRRSLRSLSNRLPTRRYAITTDRAFDLGKVVVRAVALSHDAPDTVAYRFDDGRARFGIATDLGCTDDELREAFLELDALLLEFNYDEAMLEASDDPPHLRRRIAADRGHLSNSQAAAFLAELDHSRLRRVWVGHVSSRNNRPELAVEAARGALGSTFGGDVRLAEQHAVSPTLTLGAARDTLAT